MYITPAIPESGSIKLDTFLFKKAEEIVMKSARLTGGHNKQFILAIKDLLKITNSYYSNLIESEGTHPFDIEKAMKKDFSSEKKKKDLQQLSLVHIEVQEYIQHLTTINKDTYLLDVSCFISGAKSTSLPVSLLPLLNSFNISLKSKFISCSIVNP